MRDVAQHLLLGQKGRNEERGVNNDVGQSVAYRCAPRISENAGKAEGREREEEKGGVGAICLDPRCR